MTSIHDGQKLVDGHQPSQWIRLQQLANALAGDHVADGPVGVARTHKHRPTRCGCFSGHVHRINGHFILVVAIQLSSNIKKLWWLFFACLGQLIKFIQCFGKFLAKVSFKANIIFENDYLRNYKLLSLMFPSTSKNVLPCRNHFARHDSRPESGRGNIQSRQKS